MKSHLWTLSMEDEEIELTCILHFPAPSSLFTAFGAIMETFRASLMSLSYNFDIVIVMGSACGGVTY